MTAHAAKGLEFAHVFILRASSPSFPSPYKEPLLEFPRELHDPGSIAQDDDKELCRQEERRLFYVAMTRARDSLTIYAKQGSGKDPSPPGFLRDLLKDSSLLGRWLVPGQPRGFQTDMFAESAGAAAMTRASEWLNLPPASDLSAKLSASAVQTYETCPLQFKLEREWKIPGEVPAAMQYGGVIHRVLLAFYNSVREQRPMTDEAVLQFFRDELAGAGIQDHYQHDLYCEQGMLQLQDFLTGFRRAPAPKVLHTEEYFDVKVGDIKVVGRIDRIDESGWRRCRHHRLQDRKGAIAGRFRRKSAAFHLCPGGAREVGISGRSPRSLQPGRKQSSGHQTYRLSIERGQEPGHRSRGKYRRRGTSIPSQAIYCRFCAYRNLCPATEKRLQEPPPQKAPTKSRVILSGVAASRSEAATQSKDPYSKFGLACAGVCSRARRTHGGSVFRAGRGPSTSYFDSQANGIAPLRMTWWVVAKRKTFCRKNLGDASASPVCCFANTSLSASFSSLPFSWLPWFYSPFHFSWTAMQRCSVATY